MLVEIVAEVFLIDIRNVGSMTYKRRDLQRGFEPDSSFYIQHEVLIRDKRQIDLLEDPPPDLVIEIEVTQPAIAKLPLYAMLGVPEIWRSTEERTTILHLHDGEYVAQETSMALAPLSAEV